MENAELSMAAFQQNFDGEEVKPQHIFKNEDIQQEKEEREEILPKWFLGVEEKPEEVPVEKVEIDEALCFIRKVHQEAPGVLRRIFRCLEPIDRLRSEGVCKLWKATLWEVNTGKRSGVRELSYEAITNGRFRKSRITDRHMIPLFERFGKSVEIFKLNTFVAYQEDEFMFRGQLHSVVFEEPTFSPELFKFLYLMPNLVELDLSNDNTMDVEFENAENLVQIGNMPRLKCLKIGSFWKQTAEGLRIFFSKCPQLTDLEIAWEDHEKLDVISELCPLLESIAIIYFELLENDKLNNFFGKLKKIKKILFRGYCEDEWDFEGIASLPKLETLAVGGSLLMENGLRTLANRCSKLQKLLLFFPSLSDQAFQLIGDLPSLKKFELNDRVYNSHDQMYVAEFSDENLIGIARQGKLEELIVHRCRNLTDSSLIEVIRTNKSLVRLNIFDCLCLTNDTFHAVIEELEGRWGNPPRELPAGEDDPRIFRLICGNTRITWDLVEEANRNNPWLRVSYWE